MEKQQVKELLEFLLNSFRAQLAVQTRNSSTAICPFDFQNFLIRWKSGNKTNQLIITLNSVISQGLLDSILPYLAGALATATTSRQTNVADTITSSSGLGTLSTKFRHNEIRENIGSIDDCEIIIHVCDESRGVREDFQFQQSTLTKEMGYFTHVAVKGQRLRDLDISVHCDLNVFEWLIRWIRGRGQEGQFGSKLDPKNAIGIIVSADFLQMPTLVPECLDFIHQNIEQIVAHSPNLSCLSDSLLKKLAGYFRHLDLERRIVKLDRTDRLTSRLFIQHILALNTPEQKDLDFMSSTISASTQTLFRCELCGQLLTNSVAFKILCTVIRIDSRGRIFSTHVRDSNWTLTNHIRDLKRELKTWRRVYWRLWGVVHFFRCATCHSYFPGRAIGTCRFHTADSNSQAVSRMPSIEGKFSHAQAHRMSKNFCSDEFDDKSQVTVTGSPNITPGQPYGKHRCCHATIYKFSPHPRISGCQSRDHVAYEELDENWNILLHFRELIVQDNNTIEISVPVENLGEMIQLRPTGVQNRGQESSRDVLFPTGAKSSNKYAIFMRTPANPATTADGSSSDSDSEGESNKEELIRNPARRVLEGNINTNSNLKEKDNCMWIWNPELSTRYNQDMQREREETYMINLAAVLAQRIPLDSSKFHFLRRRAPKEDAGGSFLKLEHDFLS